MTVLKDQLKSIKADHDYEKRRPWSPMAYRGRQNQIRSVPFRSVPFRSKPLESPRMYKIKFETERS